MNDTTLQSLQEQLMTYLPQIGGILLILLLGWLLALIARSAVLKLISSLNINTTLNSDKTQINIAPVIASSAFFLVMLFAFIAVFNFIDLPMVSAPITLMLNELTSYVPRLIGGGLLVLIAWLLAKLAKVAILKLINTTSLDEKLSESAGVAPNSMNHVAELAYWLVFFLFLPAILGAFNLNGLLQPVEDMLQTMLAFIPNLFAAGIIALIGWIIAKIVAGMAQNILATTRVDKLLQPNTQSDTSNTAQISKIAGQIVFMVILFPVMVAALDALKIDSISQPATMIINEIFTAIPNIIAAALIVFITYFVARFSLSLLSQLLDNLGINSLPQKMGMDTIFAKVSLVELVTKIVFFFVMSYAVIEASNQLGFAQLGATLVALTELAANIMLGAAILMVGFWLSNLASNLILQSQEKNNQLIAQIVRFAILGLVLAMGLRAMGIANEIVELAFALVLGSVAVAVALAFGLGGREAAGKQLEHWFSQLRKEEDSNK